MILQRLTEHRIIDKFRHKMYQKKREDAGYKLPVEAVVDNLKPFSLLSPILKLILEKKVFKL